MWGTGRGPSTSTVGLPRVGTGSSFSLESPESCLRLEHSRHWPQRFPCPVRAATGSKQSSPGQSSAADNEPVLTSSLQEDKEIPLAPVCLTSPSYSPSRPWPSSATAADPKMRALENVRPNLQVEVLCSGAEPTNTAAARVEARHQTDFLGLGENSEGLV